MPSPFRRMIVFLATVARRERTAPSAAPGKRVAATAPMVRWTYERALARRWLPPATYVFGDLERLGPRASEAAARLWGVLADAGATVRLLNHPTRSLRRYSLLRLLHARGLNGFDAYRLTEARRPRRFPVFLWTPDQRAAAPPELLRSPDDLDVAIAERDRRGRSRETAVVIEAVDARDPGGVHHTYAALIVGECVVPWHVLSDGEWRVTEAGAVDDAASRIERDYVETNPHASTITEIARLAEIEWGRIDYALVEGRLQVFGIDTHFVPGLAPAGRGARAEVAARRAARLAEALALVDVGGKADHVRIDLAGVCTSRWERARRAQGALRERGKILVDGAHATWARWLARGPRSS